jgi:NADH-quinone oxidoreductase subunit M
VRATDTASEYRLVIAALGIIATALTAGYSLMAMKKIFFGAPNSDTSNVKEAPWTITLPLITLSIVTLVLGIYPEPILGRLLSAARAIVGS